MKLSEYMTRLSSGNSPKNKFLRNPHNTITASSPSSKKLTTAHSNTETGRLYLKSEVKFRTMRTSRMTARQLSSDDISESLHSSRHNLAQSKNTSTHIKTQSLQYTPYQIRLYKLKDKDAKKIFLSYKNELIALYSMDQITHAEKQTQIHNFQLAFKETVTQLLALFSQIPLNSSVEETYAILQEIASLVTTEVKNSGLASYMLYTCGKLIQSHQVPQQQNQGPQKMPSHFIKKLEDNGTLTRYCFQSVTEGSVTVSKKQGTKLSLFSRSEISLHYYTKYLWAAWAINNFKHEMAAYDRIGIFYFYKGELSAVQSHNYRKSTFFHSRMTMGHGEPECSPLRLIGQNKFKNIQDKHKQQNRRRKGNLCDLQNSNNNTYPPLMMKFMINDTLQVKITQRLDMVQVFQQRESVSNMSLLPEYLNKKLKIQLRQFPERPVKLIGPSRLQKKPTELNIEGLKRFLELQKVSNSQDLKILRTRKDLQNNQFQVCLSHLTSNRDLENYRRIDNDRQGELQGWKRLHNIKINQTQKILYAIHTLNLLSNLLQEKNVKN